MQAVIYKYKALQTKKLLVLTCLAVMALLCTACSLLDTGKIANTKSIFASCLSWDYNYSIRVELEPTSNALANVIYQVDLYEHDQFRASTTVSWNQPEINVKDTEYVEFPATKTEYDAYAFTDISHIFSVKVHD
jgi:hypothetical protein